MGKFSEVKDKIKYGFSRGLNATEVCHYAGISRHTLYNYLNKHKKFKEECELLKCDVKMHAKLNIAASIIDKKNLETSKYFYDKVCDKEPGDSRILEEILDAVRGVNTNG